MKRAIGAVAMIVAAGFVAPGCLSRAVKEGFGTVRGAKGVYAPVMPLAPSKTDKVLASYAHFELGTFTDDFGGRTPPRLLRVLPTEFEKELAVKKLPNGPGGKTLLVRGSILYYEAEGLMGLAFGDFEEVLARVEFVDKASNKVLGVYDCVGRTTESVNRGVEKKAEGLAKAMVAVISDYYPKREKDGD